MPTQDEGKKNAKAAAMAEIRKTDPTARALWSVNAPKDEPGLITAVLLGSDFGRKVVLVQTGGSEGKHTLFAETDTISE